MRFASICVSLFFLQLLSAQYLDRIRKDIESELNFRNDTSYVIFKAVASNIKYDVEFDIYQGGLNDSTLLSYVDANQKGVCSHYSSTYQYFCKEYGIKCEQIYGFTSKENERYDSIGHAWNAVLINGNWKLVDPTYAAGFIDLLSNRFFPKYDSAWFFKPNNEILSDHHSYITIWDVDSFKTSEIDNFLQLNEVQKFKRILSDKKLTDCKHPSCIRYREIAEENYLIVSMNKKLMLQNELFDKYNTYVGDVNSAQFPGRYSDERISRLIDFFDSAIEDLDSYYISDDYADLVSRYKELIVNRQSFIDSKPLFLDQSKFLKEYLNTWKPLRPFKNIFGR